MNRIIRKYKYLWKSCVCCSLLAISPLLTADEIRINYIDGDGGEQLLAINAKSSEANNSLAATLILEDLERIQILVVLDEKEDLQLIAESVSEQAPDKVTAIAVRNTILGVGALLGGRGAERTAQAPKTDILQVDTPPLSSQPFKPLLLWPPRVTHPPVLIHPTPSPFTPAVSPN